MSTKFVALLVPLLRFKVKSPDYRPLSSASPRALVTPPHNVRLVSLRVKLLLGFTLVFSVAFTGAFYWFYSFTTDHAIARLRKDMASTLGGAVKGVDVEELMALYREGEANAAGFSNDPRYQRQLEWFDTVHRIEQRAWLYSFVVDRPQNLRRIGPPAVGPEYQEAVYIVDLWAKYNPAKAARFLQSDIASSAARLVLEQDRVMEQSSIYDDSWGTWISAFAPLKDSTGKTVAILGLDIEADYVREVQRAILKQVIVAFFVGYAALFSLLYIFSGVLTRRLSDLTYAAQRIAAGDYDSTIPFKTSGRLVDEMNILAQAFTSMIHSIRMREQLIQEGQQVAKQIRHALQEERELNELKSRFIAMVSHEVRTPLTVIRTSTELLDCYGDVAPAEKRQEYFLRIRSAVRHMTQLMEDVLTIGKADAGKLDFQPSWIDVEQFCQDILEEVRLGFSDGHVLEFIPCGNCHQAQLDKKLLRSILTNLLSNALKYSPPGSTIRLLLLCSPTLIEFTVHDEGIGIPLKDQPRLFELFHRASNATTIRGTGLGLAIVRQCVVSHRGDISFRSEEGVGTTFVVRLPVDPETPPADIQTTPGVSS